MRIDSRPEIRLYARETFEFPEVIKNRFPQIDSVSQPRDLKDLEGIFSYAKKEKLSIIPRGAATSGTGSLTPLKKSLLVDLTCLEKIIDFDEKKRTVAFEAGLRWWALRNFLDDHSLDVFTYPTSLFSTVGGWLATGGFGVNSYRYGHISSSVESLEVRTPQKTLHIKQGDRRFPYFFRTEGQLGIVTRIRLRVREKAVPRALLIFFKTPYQALDFLEQVARSSRMSPLHLAFFDRQRLAQKNLHLNGKISFPMLDGVLVAYEDAAVETEALRLTQAKEGILAEDFLASLLWQERFFPFSLRRFSPSVLGCEVILPAVNLRGYLAQMKEFDERFGLSLAHEAVFISQKEAVVFTIFPSDSQKMTFYLHLVLTYALTSLAMNLGGRPYVAGIWNLPFLKKSWSKGDLKNFRDFKKEIDPLNAMNPFKSLSPHPALTSLLKLASLITSPFSNLSYPLRPFLKNHSHRNLSAPLRAAEACANCGACAIVCPAYLREKNELVTAKGKLFLLKLLQKGASLPASLAEKVFLCLHCRLCEDVCQTKLELLPAWERLESLVSSQYGFPQEKVAAFVEQLDSNPDYKRLLDFLHIPHLEGKESLYV